MDELVAHRQAEASCPRGDPSLKEGISDAQWASLDAQSRRTNKSQESHRTEKWVEIWVILFPGKEAPTPCKYRIRSNSMALRYNIAPGYDKVLAETVSNHSAFPSHHIEEIVSLCMAFVDHGVRDLVFETGQMRTGSRDIMQEMIRKGLTLWTRLNGPIPGSHSSSSSTDNNRISSIADRSSTNITVPTTCAPDSHASMQALGSNAQPVRSHSSDMHQPLPKRSRPNARMRLTHSQASSPQVPNALGSMPLPIPHLQNPFLRTLQPALPPAAGTGPQMFMEDYASIAAGQWPIQMSAGFMAPEGMRPSNMGVFSDQP